MILKDFHAGFFKMLSRYRPKGRFSRGGCSVLILAASCLGLGACSDKGAMWIPPGVLMSVVPGSGGNGTVTPPATGGGTLALTLVGASSDSSSISVGATATLNIVANTKDGKPAAGVMVKLSTTTAGIVTFDPAVVTTDSEGKGSASVKGVGAGAATVDAEVTIGGDAVKSSTPVTVVAASSP